MRSRADTCCGKAGRRMRATLSFDLPEEREELESALFDYRAASTVREFDEWIRGEIKWGQHPTLIDEELQRVRDRLYEIAGENGFEIW